MDSQVKNTKLKQQIASLRSSNRSAILETIKELRSEGDVSILPELFNLMLIQEEGEACVCEITYALDESQNQLCGIILRARGPGLRVSLIFCRKLSE